LAAETNRLNLYLHDLSEEYIQFFLESVPIGVVIQDRQQNNVYINKKFTELFGYTIEDIPDIEHWWPLAYPDSRKRREVSRGWNKAFEKAVKEQSEIKPGEYEICCKNGTLRYAEFRLSALGDLNILLAADVTDRVRAKQELEESEEKFRTLAENSPVAIMIYQDDYFVYINPAAEKISGYSREELFKMRFWEFIHPDYQELVRGRGKMRQSGKQPPQRYEFKIVTRAGEEKWVDFSGSATLYKGKPAGFVLAIDITDHKKTIETLRFQLSFEKLVAEVSGTLLNLAPEDFDAGINKVLKLCGEFLEADRSYLFNFAGDGKTLDQLYEWCREGVVYQGERVKSLPMDLRKWWMGKITNLGVISVYDIDDLPPEAAVEKEEFKRQGVRSFLAVAVQSEGRLKQVLGFDSVVDRKEWTEEQISLLKVIAEIIANTVSRQIAEESRKKSEEKYRQILSTMEEGYYEVDLAGNFTFANDSLSKMINYDKGELVGKNYRILYKDPGLVFEPYNRVYRTGIPEKAANIPIITGDGREIFIEVSITLRRDKAGNPIGFRGVVRDVTQRKKAEKELEEAHRRLSEIIEFLPDATFVIDNKGEVIAWNRAIEEMTGASKEEMIGKSNYEYALPLYKQRRPILVDLVRYGNNSEESNYYSYLSREGDTLYGEAYAHNVYDGKGAYLWGAASVLYDTEGNTIGAIETMRDITERKLYEEKLEYLSLHDQLTGLYNRAYFDDELNRLNESREHPITIIVCDLDGLKLINDTLGHDSGDQLLVSCARLLQETLRAADVIARVGGDEFVAILPHTDKKCGENVVSRIIDTVNQYNETNSHLPLSISVGFATLEDSTKTLWETYKEADDLMYRDKLHKGAGAKSQIIRSLMAALGERDFITEGHANRLERMCRRIGEKVKLSQKQLSDLALLSQVHDLGKVGIPDYILFKKGPLDEHEWSIMRTHPEKGHRIASASTDLYGIADLILLHHEHWDGNGYPSGLAGEEIPVECRILAIVDAYDAMTSDRPYRKAMSEEDAVNELKGKAGTQFDPTLVEEFLEILREDNH